MRKKLSKHAKFIASLAICLFEVRSLAKWNEHRVAVSGVLTMIENDANASAAAAFYKDLLSEIKSRVRKA